MSTAGPATTVSPASWPPGASRCPGATPPTPDRETACGLGNAKDRYFIGHAGQPLEDRHWHRPGEVELETAQRMGREDTDLQQVDQPALADDPHLVGHAPNGPT